MPLSPGYSYAARFVACLFDTPLPRLPDAAAFLSDAAFSLVIIRCLMLIAGCQMLIAFAIRGHACSLMPSSLRQNTPVLRRFISPCRRFRDVLFSFAAFFAEMLPLIDAMLLSMPLYCHYADAIACRLTLRPCH